MSELYNLGSKLGELIRGLLQVGSSGVEDRFISSNLFDALTSDEISEARARATRRDPSRAPGSMHFATTLAYGNFILADGTNIRCDGIPGISGVMTSANVRTLADGLPEAQLDRVITHFHFDKPAVMIEQNHSKPSTGTLTGTTKEEGAKLLPGRASFSQYLILTLEGRALANREPLVMTADRVEEWPPIGSTFVSEAPTDFFEIDRLHDPNVHPMATLAACKATTVRDLTVNELKLPIR